MNELMHAQTMKDDLGYLKITTDVYQHPEARIIANFETLLELAKRIVTASYDEQEQAISELEEFLS